MQAAAVSPPSTNNATPSPEGDLRGRGEPGLRRDRADEASSRGAEGVEEPGGASGEHGARRDGGAMTPEATSERCDASTAGTFQGSSAGCVGSRPPPPSSRAACQLFNKIGASRPQSSVTGPRRRRRSPHRVPSHRPPSRRAGERQNAICFSASARRIRVIARFARARSTTR